MKKPIHFYVCAFGLLLLLFLQVVFSKCNAQISDFTTDSCYFSQSLQIINRNVTSPDCIEEFDYRVGNNELIVFGLRTINMGQHDAGIVNALDTTGLFWDACHYHYHVFDWNNVYLLNECRDTVGRGAKVGYNLQDGGNVMDFILRGFAPCFDTWVNEYGLPDYSLANHPPNNDFNGDTRMGVSAGYGDTYSPSTWGNSIRIDSVPNGDYYLPCIGNFSRYFNQGLNIFPDNFEVKVRIEGVKPNRTLQLIQNIAPCCDVPVCYCNNAGITPAIPVNISVTSYPPVVTCESIDTPCGYWHNRWYGWKNGNVISWRSQWSGFSTSSTFVDSGLKQGDDLQADIRQFIINTNTSTDAVTVNGRGKKGYVSYTVSAINSYYDFSLKSLESQRTQPIQP